MASGEGPNGFSFESSLISVVKMWDADVSPVRPLAVAQLFNRGFQARNFLEGQMPEFSRLYVQL
jgi:hypothetical protein